MEFQETDVNQVYNYKRTCLQRLDVPTGSLRIVSGTFIFH